VSAAAERACHEAAQAPEQHTSDLNALVALDLARIAETVGLTATARDALTAREPSHWYAIARAFGLDDAEGPLVSAAIDAAMMLARGRLVAAADALAIARGQTLRGWCETLRGVRL
jgi:hypothetical protein